MDHEHFNAISNWVALKDMHVFPEAARATLPESDAS